MQERGSASYLAEFLGTLMLVLFICLVVSEFVLLPSQALPVPFVDWSVIGLVHVFVLFVLIQTLAVVSGAHFNPAVTVAMTALRQIKPADAAIYIVAQLAGGGRGGADREAAPERLPERGARELRRGGHQRPASTTRSFSAMLAEFIGTFALVFAIMGVAVDPRTDRALGPLAIGATLGLGVMVMGPLTGAGFNPARAFGPGARVRRAGAASGTSCGPTCSRP